MTRKERRNLVPSDLTALIVAAKRDYEHAKDRYESLAIVMQSHTLWQHSDGRDICDHDGQEWPCSTIAGLAFVYDVRVREPWMRKEAAK